MFDPKQKAIDNESLRQRVLARWENVGGATASGHMKLPMNPLPSKVAAYKQTPIFTNETIPQGLLRNHRTKPGVWGLIQVEHGALQYTINDKEVHILTPGYPGIVEPEVIHHVTPLEDVSFFVEFYREEEH